MIAPKEIYKAVAAIVFAAFFCGVAVTRACAESIAIPPGPYLEPVEAPPTIPEPGTAVLVGIGLALLARTGRS